MDTSLQEVAQRLRWLAAVSPAGPGELKAWYAAAKEFRDWLSARPERLIDQVPHFVWHYLDDAEIRAKDVVYRRDQERELEAVLARLEGGEDAA
jgi:hypothetical protein